MRQKKKGVSFWASKPHKKKVSFRNKEGERVSFVATETKPIKVRNKTNYGKTISFKATKVIKKRKAVIEPGEIIVLLLLILLVLYLRTIGVLNF